MRGVLLYGLMAAALIAVALTSRPDAAVSILNLCLVSAIMALGVNIQWGYAGLFNVGTMGFAALGGLAVVVISTPPVQAAWAAGGLGLLGTIAILLATIAITILARRRFSGRLRTWVTAAILFIGFFAMRAVFGPATKAIEAVEPSTAGAIGGLGLPVLFSWLIGGCFAAGAAWLIGKIALGLRSDYLAIATLGISEIIISILKNEDWLARGVKNVTGLPRPVPYEVELSRTPFAAEWGAYLGIEANQFAILYVKLSYTCLFVIVLGLLLFLAERALAAPWGRMMRAIRDNRDAAAAMGKDVTARHLQVFVLGSAICGIAGAMLVTLDGQFTPPSYIPLRFTFLIWVMVILGGSGNNWGAVLGGFVIWFAWVQAEPFGRFLAEMTGSVFGQQSAAADFMAERAPYMRLVMMGGILLIVMRFAPRGLIPERDRS